MSASTYIKLVLAGGVFIITVGFAWYTNRLESKLDKAQQDLIVSQHNEVTLKEAIETQGETLKTKEHVIKLSSDLRIIAKAQAHEVKGLDDKLNVKANGQARDLGELARAKPQIVQGIINRATDDVNRCFEILTGSPVKEGEVNNECKDLVNRSST